MTKWLTGIVMYSRPYNEIVCKCGLHYDMIDALTT